MDRQRRTGELARQAIMDALRPLLSDQLFAISVTWLYTADGKDIGVGGTIIAPSEQDRDLVVEAVRGHLFPEGTDPASVTRWRVTHDRPAKN